MDYKKYTYGDKYFLNKLVMHLSPKVRFNLYLQPDIQEFLDVSTFFPSSVDENKIEEIDEEIKVIKKVCNNNKIVPFYGVGFDYHERDNSFATSKLEYHGTNFGFRRDSEPFRSSNNPINFTGGRKFYAISFTGVQGEKNQEEVRTAIKSFLEDGYVVTSVWGSLNAWEQAGEYVGRSGNDGFFDARKGMIEVYGNTKFFPDLPEQITQGLELIAE